MTAVEGLSAESSLQHASAGWHPLRFGSVTVEVPDPDVVAGFLVDALQFVAAHRPGGGWWITTGGDYTAPAPRRTLTLLPASHTRLVEITFDIDDDADVTVLAQRADAAGVTTESVPEDADGAAGIAVLDNDGLRLVCRRPAAPLSVPLPASPIRPRRLGHVNLMTRDPGHTAALLRDVLGLRLSEQIGDGLFFMRVGSEHHNIGVRGSQAAQPGVHHIAYEVHGWESYRTVCDHLAELGHRVEFGPGRHGPGHNLFVYVREPTSGLRLELFSDMAHIHDEAGYQPPQWELSDRPNTVNRWGPGPPESFLAG